MAARIAVQVRKYRRTDRAKRRAVEFGRDADIIDPVEVFERDGWRCYICGRETPRANRGWNEPDSPELDHVLPLSRGGTHTWGNVACACRECNGRKGATSVLLGDPSTYPTGHRGA